MFNESAFVSREIVIATWNRFFFKYIRSLCNNSQAKKCTLIIDINLFIQNQLTPQNLQPQISYFSYFSNNWSVSSPQRIAMQSPYSRFYTSLKSGQSALFSHLSKLCIIFVVLLAFTLFVETVYIFTTTPLHYIIQILM